MNALEIWILDGIQEIFRNDVLDVIMKSVSRIGNSGAIWVALALVLLIIPRTRRSGMAMSMSLIIIFLAVNLTIKPLVARTRPYDYNPDIVLIIDRLKDYSFPSGHSASSFAAIMALYKCRNRIWIPALVLGITMAFSRLYLYMHYPTDVICGILIGILAGVLGFTIMRFIERKRNRPFPGI